MTQMHGRRIYGAFLLPAKRKYERRSLHFPAIRRSPHLRAWTWRHRPSWRICLTTRCIWWHWLQVCCCSAVLLAEDNALNAEVATELLGSFGLVVDWAENGSKAVDQFEASDPGSYFAIFMDMQMPVMDGIEATKKIRNSVREDNDVPIFAMTANTFATDRKRCADAGIFWNRWT